TVVGTIAADGEAAMPAAKPAPVAQTAPAPEKSEKKEAPAAAKTPPAPERREVIQFPHEEEDHARSSPLVRKIARENNVNLSQVTGSGLGGRITKQDIMAFLESQPSATAAASTASPFPAISSPGPSAPPVSPPAPPPKPPPPPRRHSRRSRAHDPDAQDHRAAHDRIAPYQRSCPRHVRGGHHPHRAATQQNQVCIRAASRSAPHIHAILRSCGHHRAAAIPH